jgi:hypothetical protein
MSGRRTKARQSVSKLSLLQFRANASAAAGIARASRLENGPNLQLEKLIDLAKAFECVRPMPGLRDVAPSP